MNTIKKYTLCFCVAIITAMFLCTAVYAEYYEFSIDGPETCGVGDTVEITVTLSSDEELDDSDAFLVYDTDYFEYVDSDSEEHDDYNGTVRLRGSFGQDSYSCSWTVELLATNEGSADFELTDKWVKNANGQVVTSTADTYTLDIGEAGSAPVSDDEDADLASAVYFESSFSFHFSDPEEVPTCFDETTVDISGVTCKAWKFNSQMSQDVDYSADINQFYAVYGYIEDEADACWYSYDSEEESFQRLLMLQDVDIEKTPEPVSETENGAEDSGSPAIINNISQLIIIVFILLVILIIVVNVIFSRLEKNSRKKRIEERQRLSREELRQKREIESKIKEKREQESQSQNMRRPD